MRYSVAASLTAVAAFCCIATVGWVAANATSREPSQHATTIDRSGTSEGLREEGSAPAADASPFAGASNSDRETGRELESSQSAAIDEDFSLAEAPTQEGSQPTPETETRAESSPSDANVPDRGTSPCGDRCMVLYPSVSQNAVGNPEYRLVLYKDGSFYKQFAAVSGRAHTQDRNRHQSGTEAPLPDGKYRISSHTVPGTHPEVGGVFLPVTPLFRTGRSALGIHVDPSFEATNGEDGTAGCIALTNPQARDEVFQFVREYQPPTLVVDIEATNIAASN